MIGHIIRAYETGRDDAKHGLPRRHERAGYGQGYSDERKLMRAEKRLAQMRLKLMVADVVLTRRDGCQP